MQLNFFNLFFLICFCCCCCLFWGFLLLFVRKKLQESNCCVPGCLSLAKSHTSKFAQDNKAAEKKCYN